MKQARVGLTPQTSRSSISPTLSGTREASAVSGTLRSTPLSDDILSNCDCAVIVTDHSRVDYARVVRLAPLVVDTRNVTRGFGIPAQEGKLIWL